MTSKKELTIKHQSKDDKPLKVNEQRECFLSCACMHVIEFLRMLILKNAFLSKRQN